MNTADLIKEVDSEPLAPPKVTGLEALGDAFKRYGGHAAFPMVQNSKLETIGQLAGGVAGFAATAGLLPGVIGLGATAAVTMAGAGAGAGVMKWVSNKIKGVESTDPQLYAAAIRGALGPLLGPVLKLLNSARTHEDVGQLIKEVDREPNENRQ